MSRSAFRQTCPGCRLMINRLIIIRNRKFFQSLENTRAALHLTQLSVKKLSYLWKRMTAIRKRFVRASIAAVTTPIGRQVTPAVPNGSPTEVLLASIESLSLWQEFKFFALKQPMRYGSDPEPCDFVNAIGNGPTPTPSLFDRAATIEGAVDFLFPPDVRIDPAKSVNRAFPTVSSTNSVHICCICYISMRVS
jgi:hypothetical protein